MKLNIPFFKQTMPMNCGAIALQMALTYLNQKIDPKTIEEKIGKDKSLSTSTIKLSNTAASLGFKTKFFTKHLEFNKEHLKLEFYKKYANSSNQQTQKQITKAKKLGVELEEKILSLNELISHINNKSVIIILLDWNVIKNQKKYQGHFVPIVGYDKKNIYVHNSGQRSPQSFMPIKKETFDKARKAQGTDEDILIIQKQLNHN